MGFDGEWQLAGCMKRGIGGSGYPAAWLSEKKPCPICGKPVAGRQVGMAEHIAAKHGMRRAEAMRLVLDAGLRYADPAQRIEARSDETRNGVRPGGREPDGEADAPKTRSEHSPETPHEG